MVEGESWMGSGAFPTVCAGVESATQQAATEAPSVGTFPDRNLPWVLQGWEGNSQKIHQYRWIEVLIKVHSSLSFFSPLDLHSLLLCWFRLKPYLMEPGQNLHTLPPRIQFHPPHDWAPESQDCDTIMIFIFRSFIYISHSLAHYLFLISAGVSYRCRKVSWSRWEGFLHSGL